MFDFLAYFFQAGKLTEFEPFSESGLSWTRKRLDAAVESFAHMEPFEISEVADFLEKETEAHCRERGVDYMSLEDTFKGAMMRLPFPSCWFEFALPPASAYRRIAVAAEQDKNSPGGQDYLLSPLTLHTQDDGLTYKLIGGDAAFKVLLDSDGIYSGIEAYSGKLLQVGDEWMRQFNSICSTAMYAIHLIHWRDVNMQSVVPSRQMLRHATRTGDKPPVTYRAVRIGHWVKKYRSVTQGGGGWQQRWHAVIGHRQTWTDSAPQFSCEKCKRHGAGHPPDGRKSHIGTWWIDAGFAGNKDLGEIVKTYEIEPPNAQSKLPLNPKGRNPQSGQKAKSAKAGADSPSKNDKS